MKCKISFDKETTWIYECDKQPKRLELAKDLVKENYQELKQKQLASQEILANLALQNQLAVIDAMEQILRLEQEQKELEDKIIKQEQLIVKYQKEVAKTAVEYQESLIKKLQANNTDEEIGKFLQEILNKLVKQKIKGKKD